MADSSLTLPSPHPCRILWDNFLALNSTWASDIPPTSAKHCSIIEQSPSGFLGWTDVLPIQPCSIVGLGMYSQLQPGQLHKINEQAQCSDRPAKGLRHVPYHKLTCTQSWFNGSTGLVTRWEKPVHCMGRGSQGRAGTSKSFFSLEKR